MEPISLFFVFKYPAKEVKVVDYKDWPKQTGLRSTGLVAIIESDFDTIAGILSTKPKTFTLRATRTDPREKYRCIYLVLSNRVPAILGDYPYSKKVTELHLQVLNNEFVYDDDFNEVVSALKLNPEKVRKFEGNFTWLPNRKAKRVKRKEEPVGEDWWSQVGWSSTTRQKI